MSDPQWAQLTAVKSNRVITNPWGVQAWGARGGEEALQVLWAAQTFHPELFATIDMVAETRTFFQDFYAYPISDAEIDAILHPTST